MDPLDAVCVLMKIQFSMPWIGLDVTQSLGTTCATSHLPNFNVVLPLNCPSLPNDK